MKEMRRESLCQQDKNLLKTHFSLESAASPQNHLTR